MSWQDIVISGGQYILAFALLPSILGKDKPALWSSVLTATVMTMFGITFLALGFWSSVFSSFLGVTAWIILAVQKFNLNRKEKNSLQ